MAFEETKGRFGFHLSGEVGTSVAMNPFIQFYVKSSAMSRVADLAISPRLTTATEIDHFIDDAISALEAVRNDAKCALAAATPACPTGQERSRTAVLSNE
jgi:hypothetical protein